MAEEDESLEMSEEEKALIVIESIDSSTEQLVTAFADLYDTIQEKGRATDPMRFLNACLNTFARHSDPVEYRELWLKLMPCLELAAMWNQRRAGIDSPAIARAGIDSPAIAPVLAHECDPLGLLLNALERCDMNDEDMRWVLSDAITVILTMGSQQEIVSIIVRYSERIKRAFIHMTILVKLAKYYEFAALMLYDRCVLGTIFDELLGTERLYELVDISDVAVLLMRCAHELNDSEQLQHILGLGALKSAGLLVIHRSQFALSWTASVTIFTNILNRHPEWKEYFKQSTKRGHPRNEITTVGRQLATRPKVLPTLYMLETTMEEQPEPSQTTVTSSQPDAVPNREPVASQEEKAEEAKEATFIDLPLHFIVDLTRSMNFAELTHFRLTCKKALAAVDDRGKSIRKLCITQLHREMWPDKFRQNKPIDTLYCMQREVIRISQWMNFDLITLIDFEGIGTLNSSQLESIFGIEPYRNVKKINLVGVVAMPTVWSTLSLIFPRIKVVRFTESTSQFPANILSEVVNMAGDTICGTELIDRRGHQMRGVLGEERMKTLRCIKSLFPSVSCIYID